MEAAQQDLCFVRTSAYDACFERLISSDCVAGLALLDSARGQLLYENRIDDRLLGIPANTENESGQAQFRSSLVSPLEGQDLVAAVRELTDDGICRRERLTCSGVSFRVFGGTPLGIYAVGPRRRISLIARTLPRAGFLVVFFRWPHLPQQVVPCVESFIDTFWAEVNDFGLRFPPSPPLRPPPPFYGSTDDCGSSLDASRPCKSAV